LFLFQPQHYQSSSSLKLHLDDDDDDDASKDLEDALDESFRSILGEKEAAAAAVARAEGSSVLKEQDLMLPSSALTPPSAKPPPPPSATVDRTAVDEDEVDKQEREIIASLEMEEREHKKYTMRKSSASQGKAFFALGLTAKLSLKT
jgi:hypothetical protein